jgi:hypothetical protein
VYHSLWDEENLRYEENLSHAYMVSGVVPIGALHQLIHVRQCHRVGFSSGFRGLVGEEISCLHGADWMVHPVPHV